MLVSLQPAAERVSYLVIKSPSPLGASLVITIVILHYLTTLVYSIHDPTEVAIQKMILMQISVCWLSILWQEIGIAIWSQLQD